MKTKASLYTLFAGLLVLASPALAGIGCAGGNAAAGCDAICCSAASLSKGDGKALFLSGEGAQERGAYLGVTLAQIDAETAAEAGMNDQEGALIRSVFDDTPADKAGLQAGDIVVRFAGETIADVKQLVELVNKQEPGEKVQLRVLRDGREKRLDVTLAEKENSFTVKWNDEQDGHFGFDLDDMRFFGEAGSRGRLGVEVRDMDEDLAEYFDAKDGKGALILSVSDESAAAAAGLKPGDVVVELGGAAVNSVSELQSAVRKAGGEGKTELVYLRHGKKKSTDVEIEAGAGGPHMMMPGMPHRMMKQLHRGMKAPDGGGANQWMQSSEMQKEKLERMVEKLELRLQKIEEKLQDK